MKKITKLIKKIDQFGVHFTPFVKENEIQYKSVFGGVISIILYSIVFAYFIYLMIQWRNGEILPNISNQTILSAQATSHTFSYSPIQVDLLIPSEIKDQLKGKKFFEVKFGKYFGNDLKKITDLAENIDCIQENDPKVQQSACMKFDQSKTIIQDQVNGDENMVMYLYKCKSDDPDCVSEENLKQLSKQRNSWFRIKILNEQYDFKTGKTELISQIFYQIFDQDSFYLTQVQIIQGQYSIDSGIFLSNSNEKRLAIDHIMSIQPSDIKKSLGTSIEYNLSYMNLVFSLSRKTQIVDIQHVKFGELLAQVGAYYQMFIGIALFANVFNEMKLESYILYHHQKQKQLTKKQILKILFLSQSPFKKPDDQIVLKGKSLRSVLNINLILQSFSNIKEVRKKKEFRNKKASDNKQSQLKIGYEQNPGEFRIYPTDKNSDYKIK